MKHKTSHRRPTRKLLTCALASCLMLSAPAFAQSSNATLRGVVSGAGAGTEVTATNVQTGSTRTTQTAANGSYSLVGLPPGTYTVRSGGSEQTVTLSVASTSTLNLSAGGAAPTPRGEATNLDTVVVTAPVLKDVKTSEVGTTVSLRQIEQLPQATRNFLEFADTVPGMAFEMDAQGHTSLRGGATNSSSGNLYIDGVGQKSYVKSGGIAGQSDTQGNPFSQLAIGEYKVITSNYKAEYGQISGAAVTAVTRSGTNNFEGEAFYRFTNQSMREKTASESAPGRDKSDSQTKEYGAAFGGPIIKDKMHFFVAYEAKENVVPRTVTPGSAAANWVQYLPSNVQSVFGPVSQPFDEDLYFAKIDWDIGENDRVELSAQVRDETQVDDIGNQRAADHGRDFINKDTRSTLRWMHYANAWTNELIATTENSKYNPNPMSIGNGIKYIVVDQVRPDSEETIVETGPSSGFDAQDKKQKGWSISDNLTFNSFRWHGDHTIKVGASYKAIKLSSVDALAVNPQFSYNVTPDGVADVPFKVNFTSPFNVPGQTASVVSHAKQYGFFIQDDWAVNDKLILNIGVRWDYEKNPAYTNFVTSQDFVAALYGDDPDIAGVQPWANRLAASGIDPADYISTGHNRKDFKDAWAPRLGFSYDLNADEQHVIHGGAGRSYDRNLFEQMSLEVSKAALSPVEVDFINPDTGQCYRPNNGRPCVAWDPIYLNGPDALAGIPVTTGSKELFMLRNDFKTPYSDQFSVGMSNQLGDWLTDVTVQHVMSHDGLVYTLINRFPDGSFFQNGGQPWGEPVPGYANTILGSNGIETRNTSLLVSAEKPYTKASGWGLSIAYTQTHARHNRSLNEIYAFDKATIEQYPFIKSDAAPRHRLVAAGSIDGFWGITFGAKIVLETPEARNNISCWGQQNPDGSTCTPVGFWVPGTGKFLIGGDIWGYRTVDFQATKEFKFGDRFALTARLNLLNAFDFKNYSSFNYDSFGSNGVYDPQISVNKYGDIRYVPRTLTFELGLKF
ncbi:TonB-dependent receptor [Pseudoxanthomonas helianthi]|uniref:TonB-dependent receptor n=1 Tax=Pseudoxanthomonas helianthi TaxID=1453541 RepID=A0A940X3P8_9GAMM|nr:TonB-dependent receptor [Pseudoxanthomonas helianthi]MBP3985070.1 TonB-dependent receptor [Pseudoxanthomonas helianthi]